MNAKHPAALLRSFRQTVLDLNNLLLCLRIVFLDSYDSLGLWLEQASWRIPPRG